MDIAERLNALRGTAHDVGLAAIAEIERLREAVKWRDEQLSEQADEIERLRHAVAIHKRQLREALGGKT